jgi:hypothetical protein
MDNAIRTAQVLGLTGSLVLAGVNIGTSFLVIPLLYNRPTSVTTPIFAELYTKGAVTLVPLGIFSASCSAVVAYLDPSQRNLWAFAAVATISQTPWTLLMMMKTNNRLVAISASEKEQEKASDEEVVGLLKQWTWMNFVRGGLALAGGLAGVWALTEAQV